MINNKDTVITISKDCIDFGGEKLTPPFLLEDVKRVLGEGRRYFLDMSDTVAPGAAIRRQIWDDLGISCSLNKRETEVSSFCICVSPHKFNDPKELFKGTIMIGNKEYKKCGWKYDGHYDQLLKLGCFEMVTVLPEFLAEIPEDRKDIAEHSSSMVEIAYKAPKKPKKYKSVKLDEPVLEFTNFNFKLAVLEVLMYEKELIEPKFDIYEFAEEYAYRDIDVDSEGYEPIAEAKKWFKNLQIPKRLAEEVTELLMDGGDEIYFQIVPFWDGEDGEFEINKITEEEVRQFPNLKRMVLMSSKPKKVVEVLEKCGIQVELL